MNDFLRFIDDLVHRFPLHVSITYSKICDWEIYIYKKNCADDYLDSPREGNDAVLCQIQDSDIELAFAKAQVAIKNWMIVNNDGY